MRRPPSHSERGTTSLPPEAGRQAARASSFTRQSCHHRPSSVGLQARFLRAGIKSHHSLARTLVNSPSLLPLLDQRWPWSATHLGLGIKHNKVTSPSPCLHPRLLRTNKRISTATHTGAGRLQQHHITSLRQNEAVPPSHTRDCHSAEQDSTTLTAVPEVAPACWLY